jgi:hypothetical protein
MDAHGRVKADRVTGPMGSHVQGVPRRSFQDYGDTGGGGGSMFNNSNNNNKESFGGYDSEDEEKNQFK